MKKENAEKDAIFVASGGGGKEILLLFGEREKWANRRLTGLFPLTFLIYIF